jgi:hypothetical protein
MNFNTHYFNEENFDEKISVGSIAKAAVKGIGRSIANVARGATGRTKTITFEPGWLKIMKPVDLATYKDLINKYANWKTQKSKLGPKKNFTITDNRDGILGEFSKDEFEDILAKHDPAMKEVVQDAEIPMRMHVYIINNGGKAIFMDLPMSDDGKKRKYAIGLDNKAERAFRQIHGMPFQDYELVTGKETKPEVVKPVDVKQPVLKKFEVKKQEYDKIVPKLRLAASYEYSKNLSDVFEDEVLEAKKSGALTIDGKKAVTIKNGEWYRLTTTNKKIIGDPILTFTDDLIAVNSKGEKDNALQDELNKEIANASTTSDNTKDTSSDVTANKDDSNGEASKGNYGALYIDIKDNLESPDTIPSQSKETEKAKVGWVYRLKNNGRIFLYQSKENDKYYISFNDEGEKVVNAKNLINKYKLEKEGGNPEETPESAIYFGGNLKEQYMGNANNIINRLLSE